jgi:hypothetical protein
VVDLPVVSSANAKAPADEMTALQVVVSLEGLRGAFFPLQFQTLAWVPARLAVELRWSKVTVTGGAQAAYVFPLSGQRPASVSTGESAKTSPVAVARTRR